MEETYTMTIYYFFALETMRESEKKNTSSMKQSIENIYISVQRNTI